MKKVYVAQSSYPRIDRFSETYEWNNVTVGYFPTREDAVKALAWQRAKYPHVLSFPEGKVVERFIHDSFEEFEIEAAEKNAERALNKLTQAEKEVLRTRGILHDQLSSGNSPTIGGGRA